MPTLKAPLIQQLAVCKLCNVSDVQRFYDDHDSSCRNCKEHLAEKMIFTWVLVSMLILATFCFHRYGRAVYRKCGLRYARQLTRWKPLQNWLRIAWGCYQILIKIPATYQLSLPSDVADSIASITPVVDIGLGGIAAVPLQCLGFQGYLPQLIFAILLPPFALALAYPLMVERSKAKTHKRSSRVSQVAKNAQQELPLALFISFLAFPVVSTQAYAVTSRAAVEQPCSLICLLTTARITRAGFVRLNATSWVMSHT